MEKVSDAEVWRENQVKASGKPVQMTRWPEWCGTERDLLAVRITGRGDTRQHLDLLVSTSKPVATVSPGLASKLTSAADGARGIITEFASRLSEVIDRLMDFRPMQDGLDTITPRIV